LILIGRPSPLIAQDLVTFRFHGVVNEMVLDEGPAPPGVAVGSSFDGVYAFNPSAIDSANYDYHGVYHTLAPRAVQVTIADLHWHADKSFVAIVNGEPPQGDVYEAGASRMTLDSHPDLSEQLPIWIFQLTLISHNDILSDATLPSAPPDLSAWDEARLLMIGDNGISLDPMPAVMISASLTELELGADNDDLATWRRNFGTNGSAEGDIDGNLVVDGVDFLAWQRNLGDGSPAAAAAVPEPSALALAASSVFALSLLRQRCKSLKCHAQVIEA
jgi:hypothetical protein